MLFRSDYFGVFVQGDYKQFAFDTQQSIGSLSIFDGMVGAGYHLPITDRVGVDLDAGVGYYYSNYERLPMLCCVSKANCL